LLPRRLLDAGVYGTGPTGVAEHRTNERRFGIGERSAVVGKCDGQLTLELLVLSGDVGVRAEVIAKQHMVAPQGARPTHQMNLMRPRRPANEIVPSWNAVVAAMYVSELLECGDVWRPIRVRWTSGQNIDHRFGRHAGNRRTSDVLETDRKFIARRFDSRRLDGELARPELVVRNETYRRHWYRLVELDAWRRLLRSHSAGDDVGPQIVLASNGRTREAAQHGELAGVGERIRDRTLKQQLRRPSQRRIGREIIVELAKRGEEARDVGVPIGRRGIVPTMLAAGEPIRPIEQVAHVRQNLTGRAGSLRDRERRKTRRCVAQRFAGAVGQSGDSVSKHVAVTRDVGAHRKVECGFGVRDPFPEPPWRGKLSEPVRPVHRRRKIYHTPRNPPSMSKTRLEAFSDGVIAILITIMVLELRPPHGSDLVALRGLIPSFLSYLLSFIFLGIYWNNHHHMLQLCDRINGKILWANQHLLFWLSLVPFVTGWMGQNHFASLPTATYGIVLLMAAIAYTILQATIIEAQGPASPLAAAVGNDRKGKLSALLYVAAIPLAFVNQIIADVIYVVVALIWLIPDPRIEKRIASRE
jgi:uncharacterized membrane protein